MVVATVFVCYRYLSLRCVVVVVVERLTQKLRKIMLLHLGLVTFRIRYWKLEKSSFWCCSDLLDVIMTRETYIIYLWRHQTSQNSSRTNPRPFLKKYDGGHQNLGHWKFWNIWKGEDPTIQEIRLICLKNQHEIEIW